MIPASPSRAYVCVDCSRVHETYTPKCQGCGSWNVAAKVAADRTDEIIDALDRHGIDVLDPEPASHPRPRLVTDSPDQAGLVPGTPVALSEIPAIEYEYRPTGIDQLDAVLGGGLVDGTVLVLGGEPGGGKSSLVMQAVHGSKQRTLYATGEETVAQVAHRARRLELTSARVFVVHETDVDSVIAHARAMRAQLVVIDSIQTLVAKSLGGSAGSPNQVKECTNQLVRFAKSDEVSIWIIGHVTNDGSLAGPKTLKHLVDVVLELENTGDVKRLLRCAGKNRFGRSNVVARFELTDTGFIDDPDVAAGDADDQDDRTAIRRIRSSLQAIAGRFPKDPVGHYCAEQLLDYARALGTEPGEET